MKEVISFIGEICKTYEVDSPKEEYFIQAKKELEDLFPEDIYEYIKVFIQRDGQFYLNIVIRVKEEIRGIVKRDKYE